MSAEEPQQLQQQQSVRRNPRRVAPEVSVSLKHSGTGPRSCISEQASVGDISSASIVAANGEGPISLPKKRSNDTQTPDKWFDESNKNAAGKTNVKFIDDDPPFYLKKQRSSEGDGEDSRGANLQGQPSFTMGPSQLLSSSSTNEDYRSVIDDLTVENQELKRKLRKYEGMHCEHLQDEKLFEIRVFGLSQSRRRKLEGLLRDFVQNMGNSPSESLTPGMQPYPATHSAQNPRPVNTKRSGSPTSHRPVDSAYASMSASNTASGSQTQIGNAEPRRPIRPAPAGPPKDQRVQSYLQNISRGLLPRYPPFMTDKTKKRLVVRRLEQLFVGRGGTANKHSQSEQQEEVSQSAANADRRETEAMGHRVQAEGRREAKMPKRSQSLVQLAQAETQDAVMDSNGNGLSSLAVTPDQRPTRPLDLDPSRAQNAAETINYMKHLGFSSPTMDPAMSAAESEGWVPLNLLVNMAQLHTLNVTQGFVRAAITDLSTKFELSEDGQNVRWEGGYRGSKISSDSSQNSEGTNDSPNESGHTYHRDGQVKTNKATPMTLNDEPYPRLPGQGVFKPLRHWPNSQNRTDHQYYSPLFYYPDESASSPMQEVLSTSMNQPEDKSNEASRDSPIENKSPSHMTRETGSLIFYRKAKFCTDLKGDPTFPASNLIYERRSKHAIGIDSQVDERLVEPKGKLSSPEIMSSSPDGSDHTGDDNEEMDMEGLDSFPSSAAMGSDSSPTKNLSVSGIGGIVPADNFRIDAHRRFGGIGDSELVGERLRELAPTPMPPPSYAFLHFSSSSSDADDSVFDESDEAEEAYPNFVSQFASELNGRHFIPPGLMIAGMRGAPTGAYSSNSTGYTGGAGLSMETSDDSSFDMLEFARKADPEIVAAGEREFEDTNREQDVPPPSTVATIGDRSTFLTSQEDNASVEERQLRIVQERKSSILKRVHSEVDGSQHTAKAPRMEKAAT